MIPHIMCLEASSVRSTNVIMFTLQEPLLDEISLLRQSTGISHPSKHYFVTQFVLLSVCVCVCVCVVHNA